MNSERAGGRHRRASGTVGAAVFTLFVLALPLATQQTPPPLTLTGSVRSNAGAELAGARIALRPMVGNFAWACAMLAEEPIAAPAATAVSRPDGRFELAVPTAGLWEVEIAAEGHLPLRLRPVAVVEPLSLPAALLPKAETARVEVRTAAGRPVANARLLAESASDDLWREEAAHGWRPAPRLGRTDGRGIDTFPRASGEELRVSVAAVAGAVPVPGRGGAEIRVVLPAATPRRSFGVRSDAETPVAGVVVLAGAPAWPVGITGPNGLLDLLTAAGEPPQPQELLYFATDGRRGSATLTPASAPAEDTAAGSPQWLSLPPRVALHGRVTDRAGAPIAGAVVWPRHDPGTGVRTDREGRFELTAAPYPRWAIQAEAAGFLPATVQGTGERTPGAAPLQLALARRRPVVGRVVDPADRPIKGAEIRTRAPGSGGEAPGTRNTASSDPTGRFTVRDAPGSKFAVEVHKPGYAPLRWPEVQAPMGDGPIDLGVLRLVPGAVVRGTVTGRGGAPVARAEIRLRGQREPVAKSDASGAFQIADLQPGEPLDLQVRAEGYLEATVRGVVPPPAKPLAVRLAPASQVSGRVLDGARRPVAAARVRLAPRPPEEGTAGVPQAAGARELTTTAGEDGGFRFTGVAPGEILLEASASGFRPAEPLPTEVPAGADLRDLVLVLERGATVEGRVSDRRGEPVAGAKVRLGRVDGTSDRAGRFRIDGVTPGLQLAEVDHRDYNRLTERLEVPPEGATADFVLTGGWPVAGRVVAEDGAPVAGARIDLQQLDRLESRSYRAESGEDGGFRLPRVAEGRYSIAAERTGYAREERFDAVVVTAPVEDIEVVLRVGALLRGRILGLEPVDLPRVQVRASRLEGGAREGRIDPAGGYEITDLAAGEWQVSATLAGGRRQAEARLTVPRGSRQVERDLRFGDGFTLSGVALFDGRELAGAQIALRGLGAAVERAVTTDYQGAFRIDGLDAGRYRLTLSHPSELLIHNEDLDLTADREVVVELRTAEVRGRVAGAGGRPISGAIVSLYQYVGGDGTEPASLFSVVSGPEGAFRQARLAPGRYRVAVRRDGYAPFEQWLDLAPGASEEVAIALTPTEGLDLAVRVATGQAPLVVTLAAFGPDGTLALSESRGLTPEGFTHIATLPAGPWELWIGAPGAAVERRAVTVPSPQLVEVVLQPGARLKVRIPALAGTDQLATVTLTDGAGRPFQSPEPGTAPRAAWQLAAGVGWIEGLPAGVWTVTAIGPRGEVWRGMLSLQPGAVYELALE